MSECEACDQEPPKSVKESLQNVVQMQMDELTYGVSCECSECGMRLDPTDKIADIEGERTVKEMFKDEQTDEAKFLEGESLTHGME
jgi:hypothetical protein